MCLDRVTKIIKDKDIDYTTKGTAYKVVVTTKYGKWHPLNQIILPDFVPTEEIKLGEEYHNSCCSLFAKALYEESYYKCGYHLYKDKKAAKAFVKGWWNTEVLKVQYRGLLAEGIQDNLRVLVVASYKPIEVI